MIFKNSTPFETSDANELFKKLLSTTSVTNREYYRNGFFLSTVWRASKLHSIDSCIIFVIRAGEKEGGRGAPIFFYFTARNGSDKLSRRISLDPERAIKMLSLFIYPSFFFLFFHSVLFCFVLFCFVSFFFSISPARLAYRTFERIDFPSRPKTILRVITRLKGLSMKEVYQNVNILADCVYAMITRVYLHGISAEIKRPLHLVNTNR